MTERATPGAATGAPGAAAERASGAATAEAAAGPTLAWRVHMFAERPRRGWAAIGIMTAVVVLLALGGDAAFIPFAFAVFLMSLGPFFLPMHYELSPEGITRRIGFFSTRRRWEEFPSYYHDAEGVKLSTFATRSRLEPFRGMWLRFAGNREEVLAYIASRIGRPAAGAGSP